MGAVRYKTLDHWRGIACLAVIVFHAAQFSMPTRGSEPALWAHAVAMLGWMGVPIFFTISGYCIAASVESHQRRERPTAEFFLKRFRRIYPPFWCFLILALAWKKLAYLAPDFWPADPESTFVSDMTVWAWLGNLTLTETWRPLVFGGQRQFLQVHTWTLCYEEQFYAMAGLLMLAGRRWFFPAVAVLTYAAVGVNQACREAGVSLAGSFLDGRWTAFAAGSLVYFLRTRESGRWLAAVLALPVLAWMCRHPFSAWRNQEDFRLQADLLAAAAFCMILLLLSPYDDRTAKRCSSLAWCGRRCYSIYLLHMPICASLCHAFRAQGLKSADATLLVVVPVCLCVCLLFAEVFHRFIERRFLG